MTKKDISSQIQGNWCNIVEGYNLFPWFLSTSVEKRFRLCGGCDKNIRKGRKKKTSPGDLEGRKNLGEIEVKEAKKCGYRAKGDLGFPY